MELKDVIRREADRIDAEMRQDLAEQTVAEPLLAEILDYGLFSGGKRVRPLLVVLCSRLCGQDDERLYRLAIAFEYLHAATLFHDDVIDHADTRRGRMSVVKRFGAVGAILVGDFLLAQAMALVGRHGGVAALEVFTGATCGMVQGEFQQMHHCCRPELSEEDYFSIVRGKTALLIAAACRVGGLFGGGDDRALAALTTYGLNLGYAFQVVDDLLDYRGDSRRTGKAVGNDLSEGKITLPLIVALQRAEETERVRIAALLQDARCRAEHFAEIDRFIDSHQGYHAARQRAELLVSEALAALDLFRRGTAGPSLQVLEDLARYVLSRQN
jgi:octaprenyl-diphosphate synthase